MIHDTQSAQIPQKQDERDIYVCIYVYTYILRCICIYMYIRLILLLWDFSTLCVVDHLWPLVLCSLLSLLSTFWFIGTSNVFYDNIYIMLILLLWDLCVVDHLWPLVLCSLLSLLSTLWFIGTYICKTC